MSSKRYTEEFKIEAVRQIVAALGDVLPDADQIEPAWSGHALTPGLKP